MNAIKLGPKGMALLVFLATTGAIALRDRLVTLRGNRTENLSRPKHFAPSATPIWK
jgi:hypothetical protein